VKLSESPDSYRSQFSGFSNDLRRLLIQNNVDSELVTAVIESGYLLVPGSFAGLYHIEKLVSDGFYGGKYGYGLMPVDNFVEYIKTNSDHIHNGHPTYHVKSLSEVLSILNTGRHRRFAERMAFRGQTKEYHVKRAFPHPVRRELGGKEPLIIPKYWRRFLQDMQSRTFSTPRAFLNTDDADEIIYYGIPNWKELKVLEKINSYSVYGPHCSMYEEMLEFRKRFVAHKKDPRTEEHTYIVEQHYGFDSIGLDITFDPRIGLFFATNEFVFVSRAKMLADYVPVRNGEHQGVLYCFVFEDPPIESSENMIKKLDIFNHCVPLRPIVQKCALPAFGPLNVNEAAVELEAVFYLDSDFETPLSNLKTELFPSRSSDLFYDLTLKLKNQNPNIWSDIIEYDF
jgi:hypothetical protein